MTDEIAVAQYLKFCRAGKSETYHRHDGSPRIAPLRVSRSGRTIAQIPRCHKD
jgi:hypothetical protein